MGMTVRRWPRLVLVALAVVSVALCVVFIVIGLETADKLGSVAGTLIALAGLGVSIYGMTQNPERPQVPANPTTEMPPQAEAEVERASAGNSTDDGLGSARTYAGDHIEFHRNTFEQQVVGKVVRHELSTQDEDAPS